MIKVIHMFNFVNKRGVLQSNLKNVKIIQYNLNNTILLTLNT